MTDFNETFCQRGARLLRECRENLRAMAVTEHVAQHPSCPLCYRECIRFTGRHSGKTFVSHPFAGGFEPCRLSDTILPLTDFEKITEL